MSTWSPRADRYSRCCCLQERQQQGKSRKEALQQALQTGQRLIIDLDFQDFMSDSELKSLCKQVVYCWSANLKVR